MTSKIFFKSLVLASLFVANLACLAECREPSPAKKAELISFVMKKYQIASSANLMATGSSKANDTCFWKLEYTITPAKRDIVLYLSPDGQYLLPALYDIKRDPLIETKEQDMARQKELLSGLPSISGSADAPVTIVEFSDFQCPYCKRMTDILEKDVLPKSGGRVRIAFRNYPLPIHPWAKEAAELAECAGLQKPEVFWAVHDFLFQNQQSLRPDTVRERVAQFISSQKSINQQQFQGCVERELALGPITQDQQLGQKMGVQGTPTFFVNGVRFNGVHSAEEMADIIDKAAKGELVSDVSTNGSSTANGTTNIAAVRPTAANACAPASR